MTCETCGVTLEVGMFPFCDGTPESHGRGTARVDDVTWPGGKTFHNLAHEPQTFYSKAEYKRYLKAHNLEECVRHIDGSPHTRSWATMDAQTLANAAALVSRSGKGNDAAPGTYIRALHQSVTDSEPVTMRIVR